MSQYLCLKDIANAMQLSVRSARRWWKRLDVPPTVSGNTANRWSERDASLLLRRWEQFNRKTTHGTT